MPRDADAAALQAFKDAFGMKAPVEKSGAQIRLGKAAIALEDIRAVIGAAHVTGFSADALADFRGRRDDLQRRADAEAAKPRPDMAVLKQLKTDCRNLADDMRRKRKAPELPANAGIFVADILGLDKLDERERAARLREARGRVCRGSTLANRVLDGTYDNAAPRIETVIDVCWYLKGMAQEKLGESYVEGALTVPDPGGKLARFFDNCKDAYPRKSSHLKPQQDTPEGGSEGRGIDAGGQFPGGMNTVLLHPFTTESGEKRLYIKFESAGAYGAPGKNREVARRPKTAADDAETKAHALSFMGKGDQDIKQKGFAKTREGAVDFAVREAYSTLRERAPARVRPILDHGQQHTKQNRAGEVTAAGRVKAAVGLSPLYWDVQTQSANVLKMQQQMTPAELRAVAGPLVAWGDAMAAAGYGADLDIRLGDEVVLQPADLKPVVSGHEGDIEPAISLLTMRRLLQQRMDQQKTLLEGTKDNVPYVYYGSLDFNDGQPPEMDVLLLETAALDQFRAYVPDGVLAVSGRICKGTHRSPFKLRKAGDKYFRYNGGVPKPAMFNALRRTGWNMANLQGPNDLEDLAAH